MSKKPILVNEITDHQPKSLAKNSPEKDKGPESFPEMPEGWDIEIPIDAYEERGEVMAKEEIVTAIVKAVKPRRNKADTKKGDKDKLPFFEIEYGLINWMTGRKIIADLMNAKAFPDKYRTYFHDNKHESLAICEVDGNLATPISKIDFYGVIKGAMEEFKDDARKYCLSSRQIDQVIEAYIKEKAAHRLVQTPDIFCFESETDKVAFNRVVDPAENWEYGYDTPEFSEIAPIFSDFVDRVDEKKALLQFIGSLTYPESSHKQTLHVVGAQDSGKTTLFEVLLEALFGDRGTATLTATDALNDSFLTEDFEGKMAIYADELAPYFYETDYYKRLTGATKHRVNIKYKTAHHSKITAKLIATSNSMPSIPPDKAITDRLVLVTISKLKSKIGRGQLKEALLREIPYILAVCRHEFRLLNGELIKTSGESHAAALDIGCATEQVFFDLNFKPQPGAKSLTVAEFKKIVVRDGKDHGVTYRKMREFVKHRYDSNLDGRAFTDGKTIAVVTEFVALALRNLD